MATQKQIAANRRNSEKSTGPRSDEGKARTAMNALKTGIDASSQLIRGEFHEDLSKLTAEYYRQFQPTTPEQRFLLDTLVDCEWLLRRFRSIETQLWQNATRIFDIDNGEAYRRNPDVFARLQRRIDSTQRHYHKALRELQRLQAAETTESGDPESPAATPPIQTVNPENGFVPQSLSGQVQPDTAQRFANPARAEI